MQNPLIVALDVPDAGTALRLVDAVGPWVGAFKVGSELFTLAGPRLVQQIRDLGFRVFLDLKFHDIPNTVARSVAAATGLGIQMLTIHASGGEAMIRAAVRSSRETADRLHQEVPLVLGVTVLTSMEAEDLAAVTLERDVARQVERLARLGAAAGLRGFVCSPKELPVLRQILPAGSVLVTPGIRTGVATPADDQKRTLSPAEALAAGANWLVVGRPIYASPDPGSAARTLLASLPQAPIDDAPTPPGRGSFGFEVA